MSIEQGAPERAEERSASSIGTFSEKYEHSSAADVWVAGEDVLVLPVAGRVRVEKDGKHTTIKRRVVTPSADIALGTHWRTHWSLPGGERPRGGLSISSQSALNQGTCQSMACGRQQRASSIRSALQQRSLRCNSGWASSLTLAASTWGGRTRGHCAASVSGGAARPAMRHASKPTTLTTYYYYYYYY